MRETKFDKFMDFNLHCMLFVMLAAFWGCVGFVVYKLISAAF